MTGASTRRPRRGTRQLPRRPAFFIAYEQEMRLLNTRPKQLWIGTLLVVAAATPFLVEDHLLRLLAVALAASIGAIGLNIVSGYAGQVSLGHAFFLGIGAYTAAAMSGDPDGRTIGFGITFLPAWLLASGLLAAAAGVIVAPITTRLRGLYLAVVTLGLVFLGEHIFRGWSALTGGPEIGRPTAVPEMFGHNLKTSGNIFTGDQKIYLLMLALLLTFAVLARNIARSRIGRALEAIRDRDIAAETMGISLRRYKTLAFAISSFYAGCCGALLYTVTGFVDPGTFDLMLSVQFIAMVFIGGVATISGSIMGAFFIMMMPWAARQVAPLIPMVSTNPTDPLNVYEIQVMLYGLLIVVFLIFEPQGLYGIWIRTKNYWKGWPFTY